ncbi:MAG TPA: hypothetical protein VIJ00_02605 [Nakamurella sp.]
MSIVLTAEVRHPAPLVPPATSPAPRLGRTFPPGHAGDNPATPHDALAARADHLLQHEQRAGAESNTPTP